MPCHTNLWTDAFAPSSYTLETLAEEANRSDFAVLVATPDDTVVSRGSESQSPRDNVIFELGLFVGVINRRRTFLLVDSSVKTKLPSDLAGVTQARYTPRSNLRSALNDAALHIADVIKRLGRRPATAATAEKSETKNAVGSSPSVQAIPAVDDSALLADEIGTLRMNASTQGWAVREGDRALRLTSPKGRRHTFSFSAGDPAASRDRLRKFVRDVRGDGLRVADYLRRPPQGSNRPLPTTSADENIRRADSELFEEWKADYPATGELRRGLRAFDGYSWPDSLRETAYNLRMQWIDREFFDQEIRAVQRRFLESLRMFLQWIENHGDIPGSGEMMINWRARNRYTDDDDSVVEGMRLAHSVADAATELENIGKTKGL